MQPSEMFSPTAFDELWSHPEPPKRTAGWWFCRLAFCVWYGLTLRWQYVTLR